MLEADSLMNRPKVGSSSQVAREHECKVLVPELRSGQGF